MAFGRTHDVRVHPSENGMVLECVCKWHCEVLREKYGDCASMHREVDSLRWRHTARSGAARPALPASKIRSTETVRLA